VSPHWWVREHEDRYHSGPQAGGVGPKGDKGDKGDPGETGAQGPQGIQGPAGADGQDGAQGIQGEQGPQGIQGEIGPQGPQGDPGQDGAGGEAFPVGSVFIAVVNTNPGTLLGYGTWSSFAAGRVLVGIDAGQTEFDTVEETGGSKTHTLTTAEMPSHTHVQDAHTHVQNSHNHTQDAHTHNFLPRSATTGAVSSIVTGTLDTSSTISGSNQPHIQAATATNQAATAVNQNATAVNQSTGGGGSHNNLQPYIVVYMWKRVS
jgi:microcystin-dependent protein